MLAVSVVMMVLLGAIPEEGPADLVARLGSNRFAEREEASAALRRLGRPALPALRDARSSRDLEIRNRAMALYDEIEAKSVLEPTLIRLDFRDRSLSEVAEAIGRQAGVTLAPGDVYAMSRPQDHPSWPDRRVTLEAPEPVPFWEAIDRLCREGGLRRVYPLQEFGLDEPFSRLTLVPGTSSAPISVSGSFRVDLLRICRERDLDLAPGLQVIQRNFGLFDQHAGPGVKSIHDSKFFAELLLSVEPRLRIMQQTPLEHLEAVDAEGRSVLREPTAREREMQDQIARSNPHLDPLLHPELRFGSGSRPSSPTRLLRVSLADSTPPGGRLARLKGIVTVAVMVRRADPLVLPLADAKGKTIAQDGVRLTIHQTEVKPNQFYGEVDLTLETDQASETIRVQGPGIAPLDLNRPTDLLQKEFEVLDDGDHSLDWSFLQPPSQGVRGRMKLQIRPRGQQGERLDFSKLRLRAFAMVGAAIEVPFLFTDLPMP